MMAVVIESGEAIDEVPHAGVAGVKNVGPVAMHVDALETLGIAVAADVAALVDEHDFRTMFGHDAREHRAKHSAADDEVIETHIPYATASSACGRSLRRNL